MEEFVSRNSIVRIIWGKADTILLIFAGASAEFALNKAVDWLYYTGRLPADPLGRLFSTVTYARMIIFAPPEEALASIDRMKNIHTAVENARGSTIPDWAYRDVLFMLIHYSIASFEVLERKLTIEEKEEVTDVFVRVGKRMGIGGLPVDYSSWRQMYEDQCKNDLVKGPLTKDLYKQYRKHLGAIRYFLLMELQRVVINDTVRSILKWRRWSFITPMLSAYKIFRSIRAEWFIKSVILPSEYKESIRQLDVQS